MALTGSVESTAPDGQILTPVDERNPLNEVLFFQDGLALSGQGHAGVRSGRLLLPANVRRFGASAARQSANKKGRFQGESAFLSPFGGIDVIDINATQPYGNLGFLFCHLLCRRDNSPIPASSLCAHQETMRGHRLRHRHHLKHEKVGDLRPHGGNLGAL